MALGGEDQDKKEAAAGRHGDLHLQRSAGLSVESLDKLVAELLWRIEAGELTAGDQQVLLGNALEAALDEHLDVHENRFSAKRLSDLFMTAYGYQSPEHRPQIAGSTVLDLGSGCENPLGFAFLWLMLGAARAIAVDLGGIIDERRAVKALAKTAYYLLTDSARVVGNHRIGPEEALHNIGSFSLPKLARGDASGIDRSRLMFLQEPVERLGLEDAQADLVTSNSLLEHVAEPARALAEIARVSRPGAVGVHNIDTADHRLYGGGLVQPLSFLEVPGGAALVEGSNRWRIRRFLEEFPRHGFEVVHHHVYDHCDVPVDYAKRFAPPFASMERSELSELRAVIVVRKTTSTISQ